MYKKRKDLERGKRIRTLREALDLTQRDVAGLVGVKQAHVSRWELGSLPAADTLPRLAVALETTGDRIMHGDTTAAVEEPAGAAWGQFMAWLPTHWVQAETLPWMIDALRGFDFPPGATVTSEQYQRMLFVLVDIEKQSRMQPR